MANLFNKNILLDRLHWFEIENFDEKIEILKQWHKTYTDGTLQKMSEREVEQSYNEDILGKVLWYIAFPTIPWSRQAQPKTEVNWQKPDFWLWFYFPDGEWKDKTLAVVEVKDAATSLVKSQRREWNLSPIQQWFKYKPLYSDCRWVLVSNFYETRLFVDTQIDYELWTLDDLVNPVDNYFQFRKFYYLLCRQNFIAEKGKSRTEELLSAVRIQEEQITKAFYKEYKELRLMLIKDLKKNNKLVTMKVVIEKAQKIIDRMVFIHFCEDNWLLPENKTKAYVDRASEFDFTPWELLQKVFKWIDKGNDKLEIPPPWYNWGLFAPDYVLDNLQVSDSVCQKFIDLGRYDFAEDLSVNILWHIFEQSISDLEELQDVLTTEKSFNLITEDWKKIALESWSTIKEKKWKRKKDGIFYTPEYIVDYIIKNSLWTYLEERFDELSKKNKNEFTLYQEYQTVLHNVKVLDPACGSWAFLVKVFDFLKEENIRVMNVLAWGKAEWLFDVSDLAKSILQNNIYGVDLNEESVEITKLSLWLKTAQKGKQLATLDDNIKCGNSLIDDSEVAWDKAFEWNKEFKEILDSGGFDIIVGNPPYWAHLEQKDKDYLQKYKTFQGNFEVYFFFFEKCTALLSDSGKLWFIVPDTWIKIPQAKALREYILKEYSINRLVAFWYSVFEDASVNTIISILTKDFAKDSICNFYYVEDFANVYNMESLWNYSKCSIKRRTLSDDKQFQVWQSEDDIKIIDKMRNWAKMGSDLLDISQWIVPYSKEHLSPEEISARIYHSLKRESPDQGIRIQGRRLSRYWIDINNPEYLTYWKHLHRPRKQKYFEGERILIQEITWWKPPRINATIYDWVLYHDPWIISCLNRSSYSTKYILWIINSRLLSWYHQKNSPKGKRQTFPKVLIGDIRNFPIKIDLDINESEYLHNIDKITNLSLKLVDTINFSINFLKQKYGLDKVSKKLQSFYELDFMEFKKVLKIKKISLEEERQLMTMFEKDKAEVLELKEKIDKTDREIDDMVFELYGLNDEERNIVLNS